MPPSKSNGESTGQSNGGSHGLRRLRQRVADLRARLPRIGGRVGSRPPGGTASGTAPDGARLPSTVTMPLLARITQQSLDEDYRDAADRRAELAREGIRLSEDEEARRRRSRRVLAVAVVAVFGLLVGTAFMQTTRSSQATDESRNALINRVEVRQDRVNRIQGRIVNLRAATIRLGDQAAQRSGELQDAEDTALRLGALTGMAPVRGEGVRMTVENSPSADVNQVVRDSDLAMAVDAFWTAGAEAIAINGQRLTALTAIRNSGTPIKVNGIGIAPPYTIQAIGPRASMQADFVSSSSGQAFDALSDDYGFTYSMDNDDDITLPAAPARLLTNLRTFEEPRGGNGAGSRRMDEEGADS